MKLFFFRKKKTRLFGANITPNCAYCSHNSGESMVICSLNRTNTNDNCRKFQYNPFMRMPKKPISFKAADYSSEDFSL